MRIYTECERSIPLQQGFSAGMRFPYQPEGIYAKIAAQGRTYSSSSAGLMT